jgi:N6-L-threonylcarbamoyladenine synthase
MMGLGYPGGPVISQLASLYKRPVSRDRSQNPLFPRVFLEKSEFGFSFSGLKSAVRREIEKRTQDRSLETGLSEEDKQEISYEFQSAVNEVLAYKLIEAARQK